LAEDEEAVMTADAEEVEVLEESRFNGRMIPIFLQTASAEYWKYFYYYFANLFYYNLILILFYFIFQICEGSSVFLFALFFLASLGSETSRKHIFSII
jgi:hypothetical protein